MTRGMKWIVSFAAVILSFAVLALVSAWSLGLLPLLFPPSSLLQPDEAGGWGGITSLFGTNSPQAQSPGSSNAAGDQNTGAPRSPAPGTVQSPSNSGASGDQLRQQIENSYITRLQNLAGGYEGRLNGLVGQAYNEYESAKKQGKDVSVVAIAGKYYAQGNALEKQCDAQFYPLLNEFKAELQKNGLPLDKANQTQQAYEYAKASRKKALLSAAAKMI
jgi:hypothetical protein